MSLGIAAMRVLEVTFFIGMAGSALVVLTASVRIVIHAIWKSDSQV
jgi:hypothetical protein